MNAAESGPSAENRSSSASTPAGAGAPAPSPVPFDVCGPLPSGVTVLEASAGTGKTFTIAALAARYVAAGTPLAHLLLVTFTRMATGELRERVRERLVTAEQGLARALAGVTPPPGDDVLCLLARGAPAELEERRRRLAAALSDFDAATIATTHGFCQHMLSGLGLAGDVERDATFVEDLGELVEEVVDDLYVRRFHLDEKPPPLRREEALRIARIAVANPDAPVEPVAAHELSVEAMRRRLALAVRKEVERRKRRAKMVTYDDLLTRLASALRHPVRGPAACERLRDRYRVALVDEFQDTDPTQWEILQRAFAGPTTLVLIGDPKQAIYGFRGADVYAYLDAARSAASRATLAINWRSDQGLVDAYDVLLRGTRLGHEGISYLPVRAATANQKSRLSGAPCAAPLRIRVVHRDDGQVALTPKGYPRNASTRAHIAHDLAADVVALLSSGTAVCTRDAAGADAGWEPLRPRHIAVLVRINRQAGPVRDALDAVGVPAVINGAGSVLGTAVAREWLTLLEALERPASSARVRAAALTAFLGWTAEQVATAGDDDWEDVHARVHRWAAVLRTRGVASLLEMVTRAERLPGRLLTRPDGERQLTDLRHVGQLLHAEAVSARLGVTALAAWLRQHIADAGDDTASEERSRRLESDAEAVQVLTIHRSKGLEFPVVYYPYLWEPGWIPQGEPAVYHDPDAGDRRTIDVGMEGAGFDRARRLFIAEERGQDLRLAYVALTRARHQAVVWWAGSWDSRESPLGRVLFARDGAGNVAIAAEEPPPDDVAVERFELLATDAPGCFSVERASGGDGRRWTGEVATSAALRVRRFDRQLDVHWRRTSYSAITSGAHEARVASEPEEPGLTDEQTVTAVGIADGSGDEGESNDERALRGVRSLLSSMPLGAEIGSLVHAVLESVDFAAPDLDAELVAALNEQGARAQLDVGDPRSVVAGLHAAIETPLGTLAGDVRLRDVATSDRLDELAFELPLVGGERPSASLTLGALAGLLRHHLPADDALARYPDLLADPALVHDLRGYLAGSIDLVVRLGQAAAAGGAAPERFVFVDYKTNWLGPGGEELSAWHYRPAALAAAMQRAHYPLQALLYTVALHRYLRWRVPRYDPERNLGGVLYLFLRGMTGTTTPRVAGQPCGVFSWRPPAALVVALSDLLDQGAGVQ